MPTGPPPSRVGTPSTERTPAASSGSVIAGQRSSAARSATTISLSFTNDSTHGPAPACSCDLLEHSAPSSVAAT